MTPLSAPILADRLSLRLVEQRDLPQLLQIHSVDAVNRYLPYSTWQGMADAEAWYQRVLSRHAAGAALQFVMEKKTSGQVIGSAILFDFDKESGLAELGYALGQPHWGGGYMREALVALIGHAFGAMGLRRLEAEVDPRNLASNALLQKLGFTHEGMLRQRRVMKGEIKDANLFGLLRSEWPDAAIRNG